MRWNRQKVVISILALMVLFSFSLSFALEIEYPTPPNAPSINSKKVSLPDYILYWFYFSIYVSGVLALGAFIYGGLLYLTSAGNPGKLADAKERMFNAVIGLVIIFSSYIILNTINPQLTLLEVTNESDLQNYNFKSGGIILYDNNNCDQGYDPDNNIALQTTTSIPDLTDLSISGKVFSVTLANDPEKIEKIIFYKDTNYEGTSYELNFSSASEGDCLTPNFPWGNNEAGSVQIIWKEDKVPGIHFYSQDGCVGESEAHTNSSSLSLNTIKSFKIIRSDTSTTDTYYVILHKNNDFTGKCAPIQVAIAQSDSESACIGISSISNPESFDLFVENPNPEGNGVVFWNKKDFEGIREPSGSSSAKDFPGTKETSTSFIYDFKDFYNVTKVELNSEIAKIKIKGNGNINIKFSLSKDRENWQDIKTVTLSPPTQNPVALYGEDKDGNGKCDESERTTFLNYGSSIQAGWRLKIFVKSDQIQVKARNILSNGEKTWGVDGDNFNKNDCLDLPVDPALGFVGPITITGFTKLSSQSFNVPNLEARWLRISLEGPGDFSKSSPPDITIHYGTSQFYTNGDSGNFDITPNSIEIDGQFIAILFKNEDQKGECEIISSSDKDLSDNRVGNKAKSFIIKAKK